MCSHLAKGGEVYGLALSKIQIDLAVKFCWPVCWLLRPGYAQKPQVRPEA